MLHASPIRVCASCGTDGAKKKCSVCRSAWYCTSECQRRHWKAGHKKACPKLQSLRQQRDELDLEEARSTLSTPATAVLGAPSEVLAGGGGGGAAAVGRAPAPGASATSSGDVGEGGEGKEGKEVAINDTVASNDVVKSVRFTSLLNLLRIEYNRVRPSQQT